MPPHWFYVPIFVAAIRFEILGAIAIGAISAVLAGPLLPTYSAGGEEQVLHDWVSRGAFFICIGVIAAAIVDRSARPFFEEHRALRLKRDLREAIGDRTQMSFVYQPVVSPRDGTTTGLEALIRWDHPKLGPIPSDEFVPLVEGMGLAHELDRFVLDAVCGEIAQAARDGVAPADFAIHVNISATEFSNARFPAVVQETLARHGIPPERICLEVTETALIIDFAETRRCMNAIKAFGVAIAVDDFGTGNTSIALLQHLPIDIIKIDRGLVDAIGSAGINDDLLPAVITMAQRLGAVSVAEGVETLEQAEVLARLNCENAQGYYFARPTALSAVHHVDRSRVGGAGQR